MRFTQSLHFCDVWLVIHYETTEQRQNTVDPVEICAGVKMCSGPCIIWAAQLWQSREDGWHLASY